jgi:hypothetical protein
MDDAVTRLGKNRTDMAGTEPRTTPIPIPTPKVIRIQFSQAVGLRNVSKLTHMGLRRSAWSMHESAINLLDPEKVGCRKSDVGKRWPAITGAGSRPPFCSTPRPGTGCTAVRLAGTGSGRRSPAGHCTSSSTFSAVWRAEQTRSVRASWF